MIPESNETLVIFMVKQIITPGMYALFCLLTIVVGLLLLFTAFYLVYKIVNAYYRIKTAWMTREYLEDLLEYAKDDASLMTRRKSLLEMREKHLPDR